MAMTPQQLIDLAVSFEKDRADDERSHRDYILREDERLKPTGAALPTDIDR